MARYLGRDPSDGRPIIQPNGDDTPEELREMADTVGLWRSVSVAQAPSMTVTHWVALAEADDGTLFLACYWPNGGEGRLSTPIAHIDHEHMRLQTESGRVYELSGPPATTLHPDTSWVIDVFCRRFGVDVASLLDVTDRVFPGLRTGESTGPR